MRLTFDPLAHRDDAAAFRAEVRAWLEATVPAGWQARLLHSSPEEHLAFQRWWLGEMARVGMAAPHWPREWGGAGLSLDCQVVAYEEIARIDAPDLAIFTANLYHLPATLFGHGTAAQRDRYLAPAKAGETLWSQAFSEPGAGSDLASLRTRAERRQGADGRDVYVVNGHKIWSSFSALSDHCLLLARTDPAQARHAGISYFILDMKAPGLTVRPITQITGESEFAEIFLDNVEIPAENLIGAENDGWRIAQSTLAAERGLIVFDMCERLCRSFRHELLAGRETWFRDPRARGEYALLYGELRGVRLLIRRLLHDTGEQPEMGAAVLPSYIKLRWAGLLASYSDFLMRVGGLAAHIDGDAVTGSGFHTGRRVNDFLKSYTWTISGGTSEIMRNVIAERHLGLPKG